METYAKDPVAFRRKPQHGDKETYQRLPEPSRGDIYFDIEGDQFYEDGGLEYLFGVSFNTEENGISYKSFWAKNRSEEKQAFQDFIELRFFFL